jgi:peptidyl-prolyl cis-trans isomerase C
MKLKLVPLLLLGGAILAGCQNNASNTAAPVAPAVSKEDAVASVNGVYISKKTLETLQKEITERGQGQSFPQDQLVNELVQRELLVQDAQTKQLDKTPDFTDRLNTIKNSLLSQASLQDFIKNHPITDEELKAKYDSEIGKLANEKEYKARHILVKTEEEAKKVIADLEKGADFQALAKKLSTDPSSAKNGGDLDWFTADRMVQPFADAVAALEKGQYTKQPVKTQFGWHVILLDDSRPLTPPPFDAVKDQLRPLLQREKVQTMLENLRKSAKVEILLPPAPAQPQTAAPEQAQPETAAQPAAESKPEAAPAEPAAK